MYEVPAYEYNRRRRVNLASCAVLVPLYAVTLGLVITELMRGVRDASTLLIFLIILVALPVMLYLVSLGELLLHRRFQVLSGGIVPLVVPLGDALRGSVFIPNEDIASVEVVSEEGLWGRHFDATIRTVDGRRYGIDSFHLLYYGLSGEEVLAVRSYLEDFAPRRP